MASPTSAVSDGIDATVLTMTAPVSGSVPVSVQVDYQDFQNYYGADWASRIRLVQFPECYATTPDVEACQQYEELETVNDTKTKTVTATVDTTADGTTVPVFAPQSTGSGSGVVQAAYVQPVAAGGDKAVVAAIDSGSGEGGSFKTTPLSGSGKWTAGSSSGGFTWSYPLTVPPAPAGPAPSISFNYNSQWVDGKTATSSPQASWIGEGWDYDPGHIERRYRSCKDDTKATAAGTPNNTAKKDKSFDLCWVSFNAVLSLNGRTTELVRESPTSNIYRSSNDDGTRAELKTGGDNGDNDGEHWIVTTTDGTKYYYGLNKIGDGHADTGSVATVPVFGNHPGEPCYASAFATSRCGAGKQQAWQWGLDKVVDVHGNAMIVNWTRGTNYYSVNKKFKTPEKYYRFAIPDSIEYGLRDADLGGTPAAKVDFGLYQRCLASGTACDSEKFDNTKDPASYRPWWDTPGNLNCKSDSKLCPAFPSFWSRMRLGSVTTYATRPGATGLVKVDSYVLKQSFPRDWYSTSPSLWLNGITRYAYAAGATSGTLLSKAGVSFEPYTVGPTDPLSGYLKDKQLPNLVRKDSKDQRPAFTRPRIGTVNTEHGGQIDVVYKGGCQYQPSVAPEDNHGTCFPTRWSPDGEEKKPALAWFNKYVVDSVTETDKITGVSDRVTTFYAYSGAAWGKSDDEFTKPELRTYSDWRGFQQVATAKGRKVSTSPQTQSYSVSRYFRGAGGAVKDSTGTRTLIADDQPQYAGMEAETIVYEGKGGRVLKRILNYPWSKDTASRDRDGGAGPLVAYRAGVKRTDEIQTVGTTWQAVRTETTPDPTYSLPAQIETSVVKPNGTGETSSDFTCTVNAYVHNTDLNLIGLTSKSRKTATSCEDYPTASGATQLISADAYYYDNLTFGAEPTKGLVTTKAESNDDGTHYSVVTTMTYDPLGRVRTVKKPVVGTTETQYTPGDTGGPITSIKSINPKGHSSVTTTDPGRGLALSVTDTNGRTSRMEYDVFGRLVKGWSANRSAGTQKPDVMVSYQTAEATTSVTRPSAVTVSTIKDDDSYARQITIFDGLMRPVQTQKQAHGPGRIVADTRYNDHGLPSEVTTGYLVKGEPEATQFMRVSDTLVPMLTRTLYDGQERPVRATNFRGGVSANYSRWVYGDTNTIAYPPGGAAPAVNTWTDALGRVVKIQHAATSSTWRTTTYGYDTRGNQDKITDPAGSTWSYTFDTRHRVVGTRDPDTGLTTSEWDDADRKVSTTDARGTVYTTYDQLDRVTAIRNGTATGTPEKEFTYDTLPGAVGQPVASIRHDESGDYISRITGYDTEYRPTGRETVVPANTMTAGLSGTYAYSYAYTPTGKPLSVTLPAKGGLAAEKVATRYNNDGLPKSTSGASWYTSNVTYSAFGEVLRTVSGPQPYRVWTTNIVNDHTGQLQRAVVDRETPDSHRISNTYYSYDYAGNITSQSRRLTDGAVSTWDTQCYTHDLMGELVHAWTSTITPNNAGTGCKSSDGTTWGARSDGRAVRGPIAKAPDSKSDTNTPDADLGASLGAAAPAAGTVSAGSTGYWDSYTFDLLGNRASLVKHDPADATKNVELTYGYGKLVTGNGTTPASVDQPHTLTSVASVPAGTSSTYIYDSYGNTTTRALPGETQNLTWTRENRLDTIKNGSATTKYVYDALGNRILENSPSGSVLYLGDTEITTSAGKITRASRSYSHPGAPTVVRSTNGTTTGHKLDVLLTDQVGTATTTVGVSAGQPITRRAFKPYGEVRGSKPAAWPNKRSFLGVGVDDPTGLTHIGAREYDSSSGRFISADPVMNIASPLQMNGYAYADNNPVTHSDPTGLCAEIDCGTRPTPDHENTTPGRTPGPAKLTDSGRVHQNNVRNGRAANTQARCGFGGLACNTVRTCQQQQIFCGIVSKAPQATVTMNKIVAVAKETLGITEYENCKTYDLWACAELTKDAILASKLRLGAKLAEGAVEAIDEIMDSAPRPGCRCFLAGTKVLLPGGKTKKIEEVKIGDEVWATDPVTGKSGKRKVTRLIVTRADKHFNKLSIATKQGIESLTATHEHPFWSPSRRTWVEARNLTPGSTLLTESGDTVIVTANKPFTKRATTYNLTVDDLHTYYVLAGQTPILVHNSNCPTGVGRELIDGQAQFHIIHGDKTGGGHKWPGQAGKSVFPPNWGTDDILDAVADVATSPNSKWDWVKGPQGSTYTKKGSASRVAITGTHSGVDIKVIYEPASNRIITGYPYK
ncbi:polymorphic toxin-type HINT domain-containing protein [Streptomyces sp. NBC_00239]|nr:polymorphic toxin-type HINT domain-containing protein [Streptomyces sp. NBC_00239]